MIEKNSCTTGKVIGRLDVYKRQTNENAKYYSPGSNGEGADAFNMD